MQGPDGDKRDLRARVRTRRAQLSEDRRADASRRACDHLLALPEVVSAATVVLYAPHGHELDPRRAVVALTARGVRILLPRVTGDELELVEVVDGGTLRPGFRGVQEPEGPPADAGDVDVVVVPGVAFDLDGGRLGQGGGHYDRLLATLPDSAVRIALGFAVQVVERVPRQAHDLPVDLVVTEDGARRTGGR